MSAPSPKQEEILALIERHRGLVLHRLWCRSGQEVLAWTTIDDLFQETIAQALTTAESFTFCGDMGFVAWISQIANRVVINTVRKRRCRIAPVSFRSPDSSAGGVMAAEISSGTKTPSSVAAMREWARKLRIAMDSLPERYRRVLVIYKLEEHSLAELAQALACSEGAAAQLYNRAMRALKAELKDHDFFE